MCRRLCFLISFVLVLGLVGSASAGTWGAYWTDANETDHRWDTNDNWDTPDDLPDVDRAAMIGYIAEVNAADGWPVIDSDTNAVCYYMEFGLVDGILLEGPSKLYMTGGTLTMPGTLVIGRHPNTDCIFEMSGGTTTVGDMYTRQGTCIFNMSNNSIFNASTRFQIGGYNMEEEGFMTMSDTASATCETLRVGNQGDGILTMTDNSKMKVTGKCWLSSSIGKGLINLDGGILDCNSLDNDAFADPASRLDINDGTLILTGNQMDVVEEWIGRGWLTAYDGTGVVNATYVDPNTIVTATPGGNPYARDPDPKYGETVEVTTPTLTWTPGDFVQDTNGHQVYFGTDYNEVRDANTSTPGIYRGVRSDANYVATGLEFDRPYYWRIDEVNDPCEWKGYVWNFRTKSFFELSLIGKNNIVVSASDNAWSHSRKTVTELGMNPNGYLLDSTAYGHMWAADQGGDPHPMGTPDTEWLAWIAFDFFDKPPDDGGVSTAYSLKQLWVWNFNGTWTDCGLRRVTIHYTTDGTNWTKLGDYEIPEAPNKSGYAHCFEADFAGADANAVVITAKKYDSDGNWGHGSWVGLGKVRFTIPVDFATNPYPTPGTEDVPQNVTLTWVPGQYAPAHEVDVYFGDNENAVRDANKSTTGIYQCSQSSTINHYTPEGLELYDTYYWRIDEKNASGTVKGAVWDFSTGAYIIVDDFETYETDGELRAVWVKADFTYEYLKTDIFHGDAGQSMKLIAQYKSVDAGVTRDYGDGSADWAICDVTTLALWFYGDCNNPESLYVTLKETSAEGGSEHTEFYGDPEKKESLDDLKAEEWIQWNIDLSKYSDAGVELAEIQYVTIGFRDGSGDSDDREIYFDDIMLYPRRCVSQYVAADFTGDCVIDNEDLEVLVEDWLAAAGWFDEFDPCTDGLRVRYTFNACDGTDVNDSSGNDFDGTVNTGDAWDYYHGYMNGCLHFDGSVYVDVPNDVFSTIDKEITISVWIKGDLESPDWERMFMGARTTEYDGYLFYTNCPHPEGETIGWVVNGDPEGDPNQDEVWWGADDPNNPPTEAYYGQWNHYAFTKDAVARTMRIYHNGVKVADENFDPNGLYDNSLAGVNVFSIGRNLISDGEYYHGRLDDFRIYDRVLSEGEIATIAAGGEPTESIYLPFCSEVDLYIDEKINLKDFAFMADDWLKEMLWPW